MSGIVQGFMNFIQTGLKSFSDAFARTTTGFLGTPWETIRGTWFANGTQAQSNDLPSNNSIAAVTMSSVNGYATAQNVTPGTGVSFWVVDSDNWFASTAIQANDTYTYAYNQAYTATSQGSSQSYYYTRYYYSYACVAYYSSNGTPRYQVCSGYVTNGPYLQTTYYYYTYNAVANPAIDPLAVSSYVVNIIKSVAGTVTNIFSTALTSIAYTLSVHFYNSTIDVTVSDNSFPPNILGSGTVTNVTETKGSKAGIILSTSAKNQGYTIGYFTASSE